MKLTKMAESVIAHNLKHFCKTKPYARPEDIVINTLGQTLSRKQVRELYEKYIINNETE